MKSFRHKISVIIPIYNVETYLDECLNAIINQSYGIENLEVIIIDDCSTDNSYEIARNYKEKYPDNFVLIKNENKLGIGKIRNLGVNTATGDYFTFVDSDDLLPLDGLEKLSRPIYESFGLDLIIGRHQNFYADKVLNVPVYSKLNLFKQESEINIREMQLKDLILIFDLTPTWGKLYRTEWVKEKNIKATEDHYYEDAIFAMKAIFYANKIKFINDIIYFYRRDNYTSITREFSKKKNDDYIKSILDIREELLIGDLEKYKSYTDLRLFNMWRTVIFINCVELIPDDKIPSYKHSIQEWLLLCKGLSPSFVKRLPLFWRKIFKIINQTPKEELFKLLYYFKRIKMANPKKVLQSVLDENDNSFTLESILYTFNNIEKKLNLVQKQISNVYFWRLIRFAVFENILVQLKMQKLMGGENTLGSSSLLEQIEDYHTYETSPFYGEYNVDNIVFDHSRRQLYKGKYIDYKSYHLIEEFERNSISYQVLELPYNGNHFIEHSKKRKYLESMFLFLENKKYCDVQLTVEECEMLLEIEDEFFRETGVILELRGLVKRVIKDFNLKYLYYKKLFRKRNTKKVYLTGAWWNTAIIAAAHDLNIEVIDVQYAAFSKYHLGFSYANKEDKIPYYPDKIFVWGEYWKNNASLPIPEENKKIFGNIFIHEKLDEYKGIKKKKQILFISQGVHGEQINSIAFKLAKRVPDYDILVKLHPKENLNDYINKYTGLDNFRYSQEDEDLFKHFAQSEYTVGVFSTAIFEAATFDSKVILLNLVGVEHFIDLVINNYFYLANSENEIIKIIHKRTKPIKKFNNDYFFSTNTSLITEEY
jgi:glycosyltransferase involved in cell wall biosynthesis